MLGSKNGISEAERIDEYGHRYYFCIDLEPTDKRLIATINLEGYNFGLGSEIPGTGSLSIVFRAIYPNKQVEIDEYVYGAVELMCEKNSKISKLLLKSFGQTPGSYWQD